MREAVLQKYFGIECNSKLFAGNLSTLLSHLQHFCAILGPQSKHGLQPKKCLFALR